MDRESKSQSALIALARSRRMQRAMAHAYLHRSEPPNALRSALDFVTDTACVTDEAGGIGHTMWIAGIAPAERVAYVVEELGADDAPVVYRLWLTGPRHGHLVPIHAWYEQCDDAQEIRARLASIAATLEPVAPSTTAAWMLSTRVVQRRAIRVVHADEMMSIDTPHRSAMLRGPAKPDLAIRKFALQLSVEPVAGAGPSGKSTVSAFLRPNASLTDVWTLPDGDAIARVTYTGIPSGVGLTKDTVVLLTDALR